MGVEVEEMEVVGVEAEVGVEVWVEMEVAEMDLMLEGMDETGIGEEGGVVGGGGSGDGGV